MLMSPHPGPFGLIRSLSGEAGLTGRLALSWSIAGGLTMEMVLVVAAAVSGAPGAASIPFTAGVFFVAGALGGFLHGTLVGMAGRSADVDLRSAIQGIEAAGIWAVPALMMAGVTAFWLSMTSGALDSGRPAFIAGVAASWTLGLAACVWAAVEARRGFCCALERWPERRPGSVLVLVTFTILLVSFVVIRPEIWFTDLRVSTLGAVFLALGATVWIALPVLVTALHFLHQWRHDSPIWDGPSPVSSEDTP